MPELKKTRDSIKWLRVIIIMSMLVNLGGTGVFVATSSNARKANCDRVSHAFEAYTQALIDSSTPDVPRTPDEQERFDGRVALFLQRVDPILREIGRAHV